MSALFTKLESPVLTDIAVAWPGAAEVWPREPGDLYAGEPIVVVAQDAMRSDGNGDDHGARARGAPWSARVPLSAARERARRRRAVGAREDRGADRRAERRRVRS